MASIIKVETLQDTAGNNAVDMQYVSNGSAKAWNCFDEGTSSTLRDSFNTASITDNGTSDFDTNFVNNMSNDDYAFNATIFNPNGNNPAIVGGTTIQTKSTSEYGVRCQNYAGTFFDADGVMTIAHGDLA
jgi:hypothetical protein